MLPLPTPREVAKPHSAAALPSSYNRAREPLAIVIPPAILSKPLGVNVSSVPSLHCPVHPSEAKPASQTRDARTTNAVDFFWTYEGNRALLEVQSDQARGGHTAARKNCGLWVVRGQGCGSCNRRITHVEECVEATEICPHY